MPRIICMKYHDNSYQFYHNYIHDMYDFFYKLVNKNTGYYSQYEEYIDIVDDYYDTVGYISVYMGKLNGISYVKYCGVEYYEFYKNDICVDSAVYEEGK